MKSKELLFDYRNKKTEDAIAFHHFLGFLVIYYLSFLMLCDQVILYHIILAEA